MDNRWYQNAVIYCVEIDVFRDSMGDHLALEERNSVRTPMQWNAEANADFSRATADKFPRPLVPDDGGPFDFHRANVQVERRGPESLLNQLERIIRVHKECPQFGAGHFRIVETDQPTRCSPTLARTEIGPSSFCTAWVPTHVWVCGCGSGTMRTGARSTFSNAAITNLSRGGSYRWT